SITTTSIVLSWTAATDNVGVAGYDVYIVGVKHNSTLVTGLSYTVSGLTPTTAYSIYVIARDQAGNSTNSNTLMVTTLTPPDITAPTAPVITASSITTTSLVLSWTASTDNIGVAGYDVYVGGVKHNSTLVTGLSYTVIGLTPTTAYSIYVIARDQAGNSTSSNTLAVSTLTPPDTTAPTAPVVSVSAVTTTSIVLSWTAATDNVGVAGYDVYVGGVKNNSSTVTGLNYTVNGLNSGVVYAIYVRASDQAGNGTNSNTLSIQTVVADVQAPSAPVLSSPGKTQNSISLSWTASTDNVGITGYDVYLNGVKNNTAAVTALSYALTNLNAGVAYSIYVRALDAAGNGSNSNTLSVTTLPATTETLVKEYYFATSLDSWQSSNTSNCFWSNNSSTAWEGSGSMLLQSKNTTTTSPTLQLSPYTQVELKFYFLATGLEAGKRFTVNYANSTNGSFTTIATFTAAASASGTIFVNNVFYIATITMNASSFSSTGRFRIQVAGSDNTDKVYVDAVSVRGRTNTAATGTTVSLMGVIKTAVNNGAHSSTGTQTGRPGSFSLVIYPNPAIDFL
ncbi:MAG: fibronectin type III domain-containing protein, partial [Chitinophagaceae bacterium]